MSERALPSATFGDCLFGSCHLELADFVHAVRHETRTRQLLRLASGAGAALLVAGLALMATPRYRLGLALLLCGATCFAAYEAPEPIARRWYARTPRSARSVRYTVSDTGLIVASEAARAAYAWPALHGFEQTPEALLVWVSNKLFVIVPKRAFAAADLPAVVARLERELGPPPRLGRFGLVLLVVALVGAGALWAWNALDPR